MLHKKYIPATAWEKLRIAAMMKGGCTLTMYRRERGLAVPPLGKIECHHIVRDNKRMGHLYTLPLNVFYHRGLVPMGYVAEDARRVFGAPLTDGRKAFLTSHGVDEIELWKYLQTLMCMTTDLPPSKILPRREAVQSEAEVTHE